MTSKPLNRVFIHKELRLADPNPALSVQEILSLYTNTYPELVSATVQGPDIKEDCLEYTFSTKIGVKG